MIEQTTSAAADTQNVSRRRFLGYAGALAGAGLLAGSLASCKKKDDPWEGSVDLGSGDNGLLNIVFIITQLQAAFYAQVLLTPYIGMNAQEAKLITDMRNHEIAKRELLRKVLSGAAVADISPDFTGIDFAKRTAALDTAKQLEDLSVSNHNGIANMLGSAAYVVLNAKMASVEARHSAAIRDMSVMGSFADASMTADNGLDFIRDPQGVLSLANAYMKDRFNPSNLSKS
ncbi:MAG: ferritin-like domain-containing protein [Bacteroidetes bacterium]|nr:ferritin-like domain-containing protein [Bacteroidota bacterium]